MYQGHAKNTRLRYMELSSRQCLFIIFSIKNMDSFHHDAAGTKILKFQPQNNNKVIDKLLT